MCFRFFVCMFIRGLMFSSISMQLKKTTYLVCLLIFHLFLCIFRSMPVHFRSVLVRFLFNARSDIRLIRLCIGDNRALLRTFLIHIKNIIQGHTFNCMPLYDRDYSCIKSSMMVQADLATGEPGPKMAATPALYKKS